MPDDDLFGGDDTTASNIPDACKLAHKKLKKRAKQQVERYVKDLQSRGGDSALIDVVRGCAEPVLVSSIACNMARKPEAEYSPEERNVLGALRQFSNDIQSDLRRLGNMEQVKAIFDDVVSEKETILRKKAAGFVPTATQEWKDLLENFREKTKNHIQLLEHGDKEKLLAQRNAIQTQILNVKAALSEVFGEVKTALETQKGEAIRDLRNVSHEYANVQDRAGEKIERIAYTEVKQFKASLDKLAQKTRDSLLENINAEFDALQAEYDKKEAEIANYREYLSALQREATRL